MTKVDEFLVGMVIGIVITAISFGISYQGSGTYILGQEVQKKLEVCEKSLPRNEYCELIAVRKEGK